MRNPSDVFSSDCRKFVANTIVITTCQFAWWVNLISFFKKKEKEKYRKIWYSRNCNTNSSLRNHFIVEYEVFLLVWLHIIFFSCKHMRRLVLLTLLSGKFLPWYFLGVGNKNIMELPIIFLDQTIMWSKMIFVSYWQVRIVFNLSTDLWSTSCLDCLLRHRKERLWRRGSANRDGPHFETHRLHYYPR